MWVRGKCVSHFLTAEAYGERDAYVGAKAPTPVALTGFESYGGEIETGLIERAASLPASGQAEGHPYKGKRKSAPAEKAQPKKPI
jgi:hypothetical protein